MESANAHYVNFRLLFPFLVRETGLQKKIAFVCPHLQQILQHIYLSANLLPGICYLVSNANIYDLCQGLVPKKNRVCMSATLIAHQLLSAIYYLVSAILYLMQIFTISVRGGSPKKIEFVCPQLSQLISSRPFFF